MIITQYIVIVKRKYQYIVSLDDEMFFWQKNIIFNLFESERTKGFLITTE